MIAAVDTVDARRKFPALKYVSEAELLHNPKIQMVVVECRAWEAVPWGSKVIAAGKHLHLEKPPGNSYGAFKELIDEARRKKLLLQTGYVWRWHQGVTGAVEAAQKGWLGDVFMVRGTISADRDTEERNIEAHYKGGGMFELGGHVIDRVVELLGRPKSVKAWLHHDTSVADKLADNNLAVLEYDKSLAVITQAAKSFASGPQRSFEILGTDGNILVYPEANPSVMHVSMRKAQGAYKAGAQVINSAGSAALCRRLCRHGPCAANRNSAEVFLRPRTAVAGNATSRLRGDGLTQRAWQRHERRGASAWHRQAVYIP